MFDALSKAHCVVKITAVDKVNRIKKNTVL
jgi:hypothetical protein